MLWLQHSTPNQQGLCLNTKSLVFKLKTVGTGNSDTGLYINMGIIFPHCDFGWQTFFTVSFSFSFNTTYLIFHFGSCFVPSQIPSSSSVSTQPLGLSRQLGSTEQPVPAAARKLFTKCSSKSCLL